MTITESSTIADVSFRCPVSFQDEQATRKNCCWTSHVSIGFTREQEPTKSKSVQQQCFLLLTRERITFKYSSERMDAEFYLEWCLRTCTGHYRRRVGECEFLLKSDNDNRGIFDHSWCLVSLPRFFSTWSSNKKNCCRTSHVSIGFTREQEPTIQTCPTTVLLAADSGENNLQVHRENGRWILFGMVPADVYRALQTTSWRVVVLLKRENDSSRISDDSWCFVSLPCFFFNMSKQQGKSLLNLTCEYRIYTRARADKIQKCPTTVLLAADSGENNFQVHRESGRWILFGMVPVDVYSK
jgi:hypothetical protein